MVDGNVSDWTTLPAGTYTITVQVLGPTGGTVSGKMQAAAFLDNVTPSTVFAETSTTSSTSLTSGNWVDVSGLSGTITLNAGAAVQLTAQLRATSESSVRFLINGVPLDAAGSFTGVPVSSTTVSVDPPATGTSTDGNHNHSIDTRNGTMFYPWGQPVSPGSNDYRYFVLNTGGNGAHSHFVDVPAFNSGATGAQSTTMVDGNVSDWTTLPAGTYTITVQVLGPTGGTVSGKMQAAAFLDRLKPNLADAGQTVVIPTPDVALLSVVREVFTPSNGTRNFARTIDTLTNPTGTSIPTPVRIVGNLGSDASTTVFATSDGDLIVEPTDWWFGTDDSDGSGTPAIIHLLRGPYGLQPSSINVIEDNVEWTYDLTVPAGTSARVAYFTVLGTTRAEAIAAANALVAINGFGGEAAAFLTSEELASLLNFQFNTAPTNVSLSPNTVAENSAINTTIGNLTTVDANVGDVFTYSLVSGDGGTDNAQFIIFGNALKTAAVFDFETKNSYSVRIRSTDQGGLFTEKIFTITVTNVNETPTDIALSANSIAENAGANATVGTLSTTDPDASNSFTYSLVSGTGDADNTAFNISGNTLRATSGFDFETKNSYSVRIRSTDQGGLFTEKVFTITVTNVNETPTDIALSATSIAENAGANATVGTLSTTDPDVGNTFTYTFVSGTGDADNTAFNILGNSLRATSGFDFETKSSYSVRIRSTDQGGLFTEKVFTITVINAPELVSVNINGADSFANPSQRSQLTSLVVTTDLPLTDPATAFTLTNIGLYTASESSLAATQILVTNVGNVYTLRFGPGSGVVTRGGTGIRGNSLADGNWVLKISPTQVTGKNTFGERAVDKFFRMYGDSDGDGDVDGADVLALRRAQVAASYNAALDWDGNGSVSAGVDLSNFSLNQNKRRRSF
jgi:hypothetical protein